MCHVLERVGVILLLSCVLACGAAPEPGEPRAPTGGAVSPELRRVISESGLGQEDILDHALTAERAPEACAGGPVFVDEVLEDGSQRVRKLLVGSGPGVQAQGCTGTCIYCGGTCLLNASRVRKEGKKVPQGSDCYCQTTIYPWDYWTSCGC